MPNYFKQIYKLRPLVALAVLSIVSTSCAASKSGPIYTSAGQLGQISGESKILILPPEITIFDSDQMPLRKHPEWSNLGRDNVSAAMREFFQEKNHIIKFYSDKKLDYEMHETFLRNVSQVSHKMLQKYETPFRGSEKDSSVWTVGNVGMGLRSDYGMDYAFIITIQDYFGSSQYIKVQDRLLARYVMGCLLDLKSGNIVWLDSFRGRVEDIREKGAARETVNKIMQYFH